MTKEQFAALLNGREYRNELSWMEEKTAKESGLVVVYGASDDLMELRGAINDEVGCWNGGTAYLDQGGVWENKCHADNQCPYAHAEMLKCKTIKAIWHDKGNPCWTYQTDIPHATFNVNEDDELYCVGIVFDMDSLKKQE